MVLLFIIMRKTKLAKELLRIDTRECLKGSGIKVVYNEEEGEKYSKMQFINIYKGYDFLENLSVVRTYIQKHYEINIYLLELLIKLMAMRIFSRQEYIEVPKKFTYTRIEKLVNMGYINVVMEHWDIARYLYCLNTKGKNIVINFYQFLSGEKKIPESGSLNVMANRNKQNDFDKKKMAMIKKMNQIPVKDHIKTIF